MNMNLKLNFKLDPKTVLPLLHKAQPYLLGAALISIFGYTAYIVNGALNTEAGTPTTEAAKRITFDKATVTSLKSLQVVSGQVATGDLGKSDPFGN